MAEIDIQHRERSVWPWLLAGVLLLGLLWFLFARGNDPLATGMGGDTTYRDSTAAGTLAPPDTGMRTPPPR